MILVIITERFNDHNGSEKTPGRLAQQWGILVNSLTTEPAIWKIYKILIKNNNDNFL